GGPAARTATGGWSSNAPAGSAGCSWHGSSTSTPALTATSSADRWPSCRGPRPTPMTPRPRAPAGPTAPTAVAGPSASRTSSGARTAGAASVRREGRRNGSVSSTMSGTVPKREDAAPGADEPRRRTRSASVPSPHAFRLEPMTENRTTAEKNERDLEEEIHTDLKETMTYGS